MNFCQVQKVYLYSLNTILKPFSTFEAIYVSQPTIWGKQLRGGGGEPLAGY